METNGFPVILRVVVMDFEILKMLNHYNNEHRLVDEKFIIELCQLLKASKHLEDYIKKIDVVSEPKGYNNHYCYTTNHLYFNLAKTDAEVIKRAFYDDFYYFYNLDSISLVIHELTHVYQEYLKEHDDDLLLQGILLLACPASYLTNVSHGNLKDRMLLSYKWKRCHAYYNRHYLNAPEERMAIITSYVDMAKITGQLDDSIPAIHQYNEYLDYALDTILKNGYKLGSDGTNSPTVDYIRKMPYNCNRDIASKYQLIKHDDSTYDTRLLTGLSLSNEEYFDLVKTDNAKIKKINTFI